MPVMKSFAFAPIPKTSSDPVQMRREKTVGRLEEQLRLFQNPGQKRSVQRWETVEGQRVQITKEKAIKPWWRVDGTGKVFMSIQFGGKPLEFEKGKAAIAVPTKDKLPEIIETLITAVRAGELDALLKQASEQRPFAKKRAA